MITTFTLKLVVEEPVSFQSFSGFASCGIFYSLIKSVDEGLAERLHSSKRLAPWAASPLFLEYPPPPRLVYRSIPAPSMASVTFSIMDAKLSEVFKEAILRPGLCVNLVSVKAKVTEVSVNTYKFSDLASADPLPTKFSLSFLTPTAFKRSIYDCCPGCPHYVEYASAAREGRAAGGPCKYASRCRGVVVPLPMPSLMFRNLAKIWSAFSGVGLDAWGAAQWAGDAVVVSGFPKPGIRTVRVYEHPTTNKWVVGFVGTVRFSIREEEYRERQARAAAALLKMAELTNVGVRRTAGLGMVRFAAPEGGPGP